MIGQGTLGVGDDGFENFTITDTADGALVQIHDGVFATVKGIAAAQLTAADFFFAGQDVIAPHGPAAAFEHTFHAELVHPLGSMQLV